MKRTIVLVSAIASTLFLVPLVTASAQPAPVPQVTAQCKDAQTALNDLFTRLDRAREADREAVRLQAIADKTDAVALQTAADKTDAKALQAAAVDPASPGGVTITPTEQTAIDAAIAADTAAGNAITADDRAEAAQTIANATDVNQLEADLKARGLNVAAVCKDQQITNVTVNILNTINVPVPTQVPPTTVTRQVPVPGPVVVVPAPGTVRQAPRGGVETGTL